MGTSRREDLTARRAGKCRLPADLVENSGTDQRGAVAPQTRAAVAPRRPKANALDAGELSSGLGNTGSRLVALTPLKEGWLRPGAYDALDSSLVHCAMNPCKRGIVLDIAGSEADRDRLPDCGARWPIERCHAIGRSGAGGRQTGCQPVTSLRGTCRAGPPAMCNAPTAPASHLTAGTSRAERCRLTRGGGRGRT
jgi:hypothetical protein